MRGYRKRPGTQGFSVPLVGAFLFFIISLFLFASYKNSACQQAKKEIYSLYTANRAFDLDEVYQDGLTAIYAKEYGKTATEAGCEALEQTGLPYVLLLSQFSAPVERVYVTNCQLSETGREKKARTYDYTVSVRFCLEKAMRCWHREDDGLSWNCGDEEKGMVPLAAGWCDAGGVKE
ncbi:MAG: hypothetical protein ACLTR6_10380 [Clostridium fessum]